MYVRTVRTFKNVKNFNVSVVYKTLSKMMGRYGNFYSKFLV